MEMNAGARQGGEDGTKAASAHAPAHTQPTIKRKEGGEEGRGVGVGAAGRPIKEGGKVGVLGEVGDDANHRGDAREHHARQHHQLDDGEVVLDHDPDLGHQGVAGAGKQDAQDGDATEEEVVIVLHHERMRPGGQEVLFGPKDGVHHVLAKGDGEGGTEARAHEPDHGLGEHEAHQCLGVGEGDLEVLLVPPRHGEHGPQLHVGPHAKEGDEGADKEDDKHHPDAAHHAEEDAGDGEDATPDDHAHHHHGAGEEGHGAGQGILLVGRLHGGWVWVWYGVGVAARWCGRSLFVGSPFAAAPAITPSPIQQAGWRPGDGCSGWVGGCNK
jgi:hypothetical protein